MIFVLIAGHDTLAIEAHEALMEAGHLVLYKSCEKAGSCMNNTREEVGRFREAYVQGWFAGETKVRSAPLARVADPKLGYHPPRGAKAVPAPPEGRS